MEDTIILAIESSCDETAVAVIKNGHEILSNVVSTQIAIHRRYGGVVPEIASRKHLELINVVIAEALEQAKLSLTDMTHIAVTYGPGLVGALLVGVATAKALAFSSGKPLIGVHHIEGHICCWAKPEMMRPAKHTIRLPAPLDCLIPAVRRLKNWPGKEILLPLSCPEPGWARTALISVLAG